VGDISSQAVLYIEFEFKKAIRNKLSAHQKLHIFLFID